MSTKSRGKYSYRGSDFPPRHPFLHLIPAAMTLQRSTRYAFDFPHNITYQEWETLVDHPAGYGRVHLGSQKRMFLMAFYHQLHCVRELYRGIYDIHDTSATFSHVDHCIHAAASLEEGDFMELPESTGADLFCWDWEAIYQGINASWMAFESWKKSSDRLA
ncbi:hypothetical protein K435DRAFT_830537 [Dendrothele bispora CBS 962.96]|uniref:Uncharacterized protein n=1 Tax=Dendrothele bispora (strain CBS 962.96) TaxID=1314807 RepID=A0A4S8LHE2_DENBC|nr:hypothetical protein K435DRAFT_830537 [Dendrothele bispora CBS 962.96]